jgi:iron(III) transport system ATP-binding protein
LQDLAAARAPTLLWLKGAVEAAEFLGETTRYRVRVDRIELTADQAHLGSMRNFGEGSRVALGVAPKQLRGLRG